MIYAFADFELNDQTFEIRKAGQVVALERRAFDVVAYLIRNRARVVPKAELFRAIWSGRIVTDASLSIVISAARRALGDDAVRQVIIGTQHGRGYRFVADVIERALTDDPGNNAARFSAQFVGREPELEALDSARAAARAGYLRIVALAGEPGIGKTRVIEHFAERLNRTDHVALVARSPDEPGAPPFWPWIQILRSYLESIAPIELPAFLTGLGDIAHLLPEIRSHLRSSPPPLVDASQARFRLFDAIATCLERAAQRTPLSILLDDIHRADEASLLLLSYLARAIPQCPLLVVVAYRDTERNSLLSRTVATLMRSPAARSLSVQGLESVAAKALLESIAGRTLDSSTVDRLFRKSGGNPYFLTQLARCIARFEVSDSPVDLPSDLADAIAMQIDGLPQETKNLLEIAAVAGSELSVSLLAATAELEKLELLPILQDAIDARVVVASGALGRYRFAHALLRDALYQRLSTVRRTHLHQRIAKALLRLHPSDQSEHISAVAHHFYEAASLGLVEEAIEFSRRAGDHASARCAYEAAAYHYERALELCDLSATHEEIERCQLLRMLGAQLTKAGERKRAKHVFNRLAVLASNSNASALLAEAALGLAPGVFALEFGVVDNFQIDLAESALSALREELPSVKAKLLARLSMAIHWSADDDSVRSIVRRASKLAERLSDPEVTCNVLQAAWFARRDPETVDHRFELAQQLAGLDRSRIEPESQLVSQLFWMTSLLERGEMALFATELQRFNDLAQLLRQPQALWYTWMLDGMRALLKGDFERAAQLVGQFTALGRKVGDANADHSAIAQTLIINYAKGGLAALVPAARGISRQYPSLTGWRASLPWLLANLGRLEEAAAEVEPILREEPWSARKRLDWPATAVLLAETVVMLGDRTRAQGLYQALLPLRTTYAIIGLSVVNWGSYSRQLGLLAGCMGRWPEAIGHLEDAVRMNEAIGAYAWLVHSQLDLARALPFGPDDTLAQERRRRLIHAAHATAKRLGMPILAGEAESMLEEGTHFSSD